MPVIWWLISCSQWLTSVTRLQPVSGKQWFTLVVKTQVCSDYHHFPLLGGYLAVGEGPKRQGGKMKCLYSPRQSIVCSQLKGDFLEDTGTTLPFPTTWFSFWCYPWGLICWKERTLLSRWIAFLISSQKDTSGVGFRGSDCRVERGRRVAFAVPWAELQRHVPSLQKCSALLCKNFRDTHKPKLQRAQLPCSRC